MFANATGCGILISTSKMGLIFFSNQKIMYGTLYYSGESAGWVISEL